MRMPWFCHYRERGLLWFRVFGYGLFVKDVRRHPMLFSERAGLYTGFRVGPYLVEWLRKPRW